jgi:predicted metalloprotease with PDZ domain
MVRRGHVLWLVLVLGAAASAGDAPDVRAIQVAVDMREAWSGLARATEEIPVVPGPLRLCYRRWDRSSHAESDGITRISYLSMLAGSQPVEWRRVEKDPWSFACTIPADVDTLTVTIAVATDFDEDEWNCQSTSTGSIALVPWGDLLLYPAERDVEQLRARGSLRVPDGWGFATSLEESGRDADGTVRFRETSLSDLVDSPVAIGRTVRIVPLPVTATKVPHALAVVSERDVDLPELFGERLGHAIDETQAILGSPPMDRYTFLLLVGEGLDGGGREHVRSSAIFLDPGDLSQAWVLPTFVHEYVHAWNGRRYLPAGMRVRDFQETPDFRMIWVYEGLTNYLSYVIVARSDPEGALFAKWALGWDAATAQRQAPAGGWRSLEDVCATAPVEAHDLPWEDRRREGAQYGEATLLWLEVDCALRCKTDGGKSLDDFCRSFFGRTAEGPVVTYDWDTIVGTLASLVDMDWSGLLRERVRTTRRDPAAGLAAMGFKVVLVPLPVDLSQIRYRRKGRTCAGFPFSIGAVVASDGTVLDVSPGGPFDAAKIGPGWRIATVNVRTFYLDRLLECVASTVTKPLELTVVRGSTRRRVELDYKGGCRVPRIVRADGPDLFPAIFRSGD